MSERARLERFVPQCSQSRLPRLSCSQIEDADGSDDDTGEADENVDGRIDGGLHVSSANMSTPLEHRDVDLPHASVGVHQPETDQLRPNIHTHFA